MSAHKKKCPAKPAASKCPAKSEAPKCPAKAAPSCPVDAEDRANIKTIRETFNLKSDVDAVKAALSFTAGCPSGAVAKNDNHAGKCPAKAQKCTREKKCTR